MRKLVLLMFYVISLLVPNYVKPNQPQLNTYTIYFEENGGSEIADITAQETTKISTSGAPTKEGYTFDGWYLAEDLSGEEYVLETMPSENITLYAKWVPTEYVITYHLDLGTNNVENPDIFTIEDDTIILQDPTKENYLFEGWYQDAELTTEITQIECASTLNNVDIYAKFTAEKYYITFYSYDGITELLQERLVSFNETLPIVEKTGSVFAGWSRQINNTNSTLYTTTPDLGDHLAEVKLYANWTDVEYNVKFVDYVSETDFDGTDFSGTMPTTWTYGTEFAYTISMRNLTLETPYNNSGAIFVGYKYYASGTWQTINKLDASCIENGILKEDSTLLIFAEWQTSFCTITFDANGGTFSNGSTTMVAGVEKWSDIIKNITAPTLEGKTFAGWADADGELVANAEHQFSMESLSAYFFEDPEGIPGFWTYPGTATLYAIWE